MGTIKQLIWDVFGVKIWSMIFGNPCAPKNCPLSSPECADGCLNIKAEEPVLDLGEALEHAQDVMEEKAAIEGPTPEQWDDIPY